MPARPITTDDVPGVVYHFLEEHGLTQLGWVFQWDNAKRRAGACWHRRKVVTLSRHYVELNVSDRFDDVVDTILHEIAHALAGYEAHHGPHWKAMCQRVGARPERCYDTKEVKMPEGRITATCPGCGKVYRRHKKLTSGRWCYCQQCGPNVGRLTFARDGLRPTTVASDVPPAPRKLRE